MLCTFILHLIFFLFLILYPQHTPRPGGCVFYLSYFLLHLFLFCEVVWISFFSFFTHSTLLACGRGWWFIFVTFFFIYSCFGACLDFVFLILYPQHFPRLWGVFPPIPLHRILCCRRRSSLLPCLLVCFRAKGCLMICFLFFRMSNIY